KLELDFGPGFNVLTGETGAGKTILVEALNVSLGGRCQADLIRTGQERALVQSSFDTNKNEMLARKLNEYGLAAGNAEEELLILTRELNRQGRNICRVNGRIVNLGVFRELAGLLVDMHGQHEQQSLLLPEKQLLLLDRYGGTELTALVEQTGQAFRDWRSTVVKRDAINSGNRDRRQRVDTLKFQIKEIDSATLAGEDENELYLKRNRLANAERIGQLTESVLQKIHQGQGHSPAAVDLLGEAKLDLDELYGYLPEVKNCLDNLYSALCLVEETARDIAVYRESMEIRPEELNFVEARLALIERLKRKYADSLVGILAYRDSAAAELEELQAAETDAAGIQAKVQEKERIYHELAARTSLLREKAARQLEREIKRELQQLAMRQINFAVELTGGEPSSTGSDKMQFLFSPNPGEPLRTLARTASGGELSRVMLALRTILAIADDTATLVFDEIDAGIGGRTIHTMAEKLDRLSEHRQIISITHAAVVAACATTHYLVQKSTVVDRTVTSVKKLVGEARIRELNRMLGGDENSELLAGYVRKMIK
ncbi:MAG: DNA repair protein RecN, partial [Desulfotomaculaceae bacterium]